jgi:hypothetical protein
MVVLVWFGLTAASRADLAGSSTGANDPGLGNRVAESTPASVDCPGIDIRSGAASYQVGAQAGEVTPTTLRYQADINKTARECSSASGNITIKVGIQGRVILGPAGASGDIVVPLRLALVREGVEPKTLWTKLYRIPVTLPPGQTNVPFVQVEEDMTVPMPSPSDLAACIIYVGFDPSGAKPEPAKPKPRKKPGTTG